MPGLTATNITNIKQIAVLGTHDHPTAKPEEMRLRIENRFWEKVDIGDEDECWKWTASTTDDGYGWFWTESGMELAHRVAYRLLIAEIDDEDDYTGEVQINHHCNTPSCVRPEHIYAGTQVQNVADSLVHGERETKLDPDDVYDIRQRYDADDDVTYADLADEYNISGDMIHRVVTGKSYAYID